MIENQILKKSNSLSNMILYFQGVIADSYDFGNCIALKDPVAVHPRYYNQ